MILDLSLNEITTDRCLVINERQTIEGTVSLERSSDLKILENQVNKKIRTLSNGGNYIINIIPFLKGRKLTINILYSKQPTEEVLSYKRVMLLLSQRITPDSKLRLDDDKSNLDATVIKLIKI